MFLSQEPSAINTFHLFIFVTWFTFDARPLSYYFANWSTTETTSWNRKTNSWTIRNSKASDATATRHLWSVDNCLFAPTKQHRLQKVTVLRSTQRCQNQDCKFKFICPTCQKRHSQYRHHSLNQHRQGLLKQQTDTKQIANKHKTNFPPRSIQTYSINTCLDMNMLIISLRVLAKVSCLNSFGPEMTATLQNSY